MRRKYIIAVGLLVLVVLWFVIDGLASPSNGFVQRVPVSRYIPTAESLLQSPLPIPSFIYDISPSPRSTMNRDENICITIDSKKLHADTLDILLYTRISINNQRIPMDESSGLSTSIVETADFQRVPMFCLVPNLNVGKHIFRLDVGMSIWDVLLPNDEHSYTWSYEIS